MALPALGRARDSATVELVRDGAAREVLAGTRPLRVAVSRTRPPAVVAHLAGRPDVELVPMGSNGVKVMAVVDGSVDAYVHAGGQYEWDSAAPVAVAHAAGLRRDPPRRVAARLQPAGPVVARPRWSATPRSSRTCAACWRRAGTDDAPGAPRVKHPFA